MKKLFFLTFATVFFILTGSAQEKEKSNVSVKVGGFIQYSIFFDTYESVETRDGTLLLYPKQASLDSNNNDVNENSKLQMVSIQTRPKISIDGPVIAGAKSSGLVEVDFFGTTQENTRLIRLRHAYFKLKWENTELLVGQYWHPMFATTCYPTTIHHGAGAPFHPLNRSPQIRFSYFPRKAIKLQLSLHSAGYHKSKGSIDAMRNSGIPETQFNFEAKNNLVLVGATFGYKVLQPRIITDNKYKTTKSIGSYNIELYSKLSLKKLTLKIEGVYGENLSNLIMVGGYGATQNPELVDDYEYTNLPSYSVWTDLNYKMKSVSIGIFLAQSGINSNEDDYYALPGYARGANIKKFYRISPRITKSFNKLSVSAEYMFTGAVYGIEFDNKGKVIATEDPVASNRFLLSTKYIF